MKRITGFPMRSWWVGVCVVACVSCEGTGTISGQLRRFQGGASGVWSGATYTTPEVLKDPSSPLRRTLSGLRKHPLNKLPKGASWIPGDVIVRTERAGVGPESLAASVAKHLESQGFPGLSATHGGFASEFLHLVKLRGAGGAVPTEGETKLFAAAVASLPGVKFTDVNLRQFITAVPNDSLYSYQWHYPAMQLPAAWDVSTGADSVVVAIIDTGVVPHPQLAPRLADGIDMISETSISNDGDGRDDDPTDPGRDQPQSKSSWHGTHVAGTIGASTNDGTNVAGVTWRSKLLPVRCLGKGGGTLFDIAAGIVWATGGTVPNVRANATPAKVVNMSLGGDSEPVDTYQDAIDGAVSRGAIMVVAAGNEDEDTAEKTPCNQDKVICVGATRFSGRRASYSNHGDQVDVMAPGGELEEDANGDEYPDGVLSTYWDGTPDTYFLQGTSMATPHVAGLVALMASVKSDLTVQNAEQLLKDTATSGSRCNEGCGAGLVNARAAVSTAKGQQPSGPAKLSLSSTDMLLRGTEAGTLAVTNVGGRKLSVSLATSGDEGSRLRATPTFDVEVGQTYQLEVSADVGGLADGTHAAILVVSSNGGSANVNVRIVAGAAADGKDAIVAVVYEDENGEWQLGAGAEAKAADDYKWKAPDLTPGKYFVLAGIDMDGNGEYFEEGEPVGFYPTFAEPDAVEVKSDEEVTGVDFALIPFKDVSDTPTENVGAECSADGECTGEGAFCITGWVGGFCSTLCTDAACPAGSKCYGEGDALYCITTCSDPGGGQSDCRDGYVCYDDYAGSALCFPACTSDNDCAEGSSCGTSGYCE